MAIIHLAHVLLKSLKVSKKIGEILQLKILPIKITGLRYFFTRLYFSF